MLRQLTPDIDLKIKALLLKQNAYVDGALSSFIHDTLFAMNEICQRIQLDPEKALKIQEAFIQKLTTIHYMQAYVKKTIKRSSNNSLELDYDEFKKFMAAEIPSLMNLETFMMEELGIQDSKMKIINQIVRIKKILNSYAGDNKKNIINTANKEIDKLLQSLKDSSYFEIIAEIKTKMTLIINNMQLDEDVYHKGLRLFPQCRKSNSSLQPKILEAKKLLSGLVLDDGPKEPKKIEIINKQYRGTVFRAATGSLVRSRDNSVIFSMTQGGLRKE
jgi:hypothetical protein